MEQSAEPTQKTVKIGRKSAMLYMLAISTSLNRGSSQVTLQARGGTIIHAIDIAQLSQKHEKMRHFALKVAEVKIGEDSVAAENGTQRPVSTIEITLKRGQIQ